MNCRHVALKQHFQQINLNKNEAIKEAQFLFVQVVTKYVLSCRFFTCFVHVYICLIFLTLYRVLWKSPE
jgi:hypothetical protein